MNLLFSLFFLLQNKRLIQKNFIKRNLNIVSASSEGQKNYKRLLYDKYTDLINKVCNAHLFFILKLIYKYFVIFNEKEI